MNKLWIIFCFISIITLLIISPELVLPSALSASSKAVELSFVLCASYTIWMGFFNILSQTKLPFYFSKILSPIIDFIFGKKTLTPTQKNYISLNMSANILGLNAASTPLGIKAVESLWNGEEKASFAIVMFIVLNTTSLQIFPSTVISILVSLNSVRPSRIILPSIIASLTSTFIGILCVKLFYRKR